MKVDFGPYYTIKDVDGKLRAQPDTAALEPDFKIFTGAMSVDPASDTIVRMVGSSTETDLQGDTMALSALSDMSRVQPGLAIWLNHDYTLPESLFGSLAASPRIIQQNGVADLQLAVDVEPDSPKAMQTLRYIQRGKVRLGCSIGCKVLKYEFIDTNADPNDIFSLLMSPMRILSVQTLEWSVVGVPANQRSWVENAAVGVFQRTLDPRLAPAVKSLFPREYERIVARIEDRDQREELAHIPARPQLVKKLSWEPNRNIFVLENSVDATENLIARDHLPSVLRQEHAEYTDTIEKQAEDMLEKGASGKSSWPLTDRDVAWDNGEATQAVEKWADGNASKLASVHFWKDSSADGTLIGSYKLLFCDVIGGDVKAVPKGIFACAAAMQGSHGNKPDIDDQDGVRSKIAGYYRKMAKEFKDPTIVPPWEQESGKSGVADKLATAGEKQGESPNASESKLGEAPTEMETTPVETPQAVGATSPTPPANNQTTASTRTASAPPTASTQSEPSTTFEASAPTESATSEAIAPSDLETRGGQTSQSSDSQPLGEKPNGALEAPAADAPPPVDKEAGVTPPQESLDPARASMLRSYNEIGKLLGFSEVDPTGKRKDAGGVDITGVDMESVIRFAHRLDDIADINAGLTDDLLHALGQPDSDDLAGAPDGSAYGGDSDAGYQPFSQSSANDFSLLLRGWQLLKAGARHSQADMKALQAIHDSVMALTDGMVCSAQSDNHEPDNDNDNDANEPANSEMGTMAAAVVPLIKELGELRAVFGNINLKAFEVEVQKSVTKLAEIEQTLEARRLEAEQIAEQAKTAKLDAIKAATYADEAKQSIDKLTNMPLGRPSGQLGRRVIADPAAVQFNEMLQLAEKPETVDAQPTLKDALAHTSKTYVKGVGECRLWPAGVGKGVRPKLTNDQKIIMSPAEISAYNEGNEALVPIIDFGE